MDGITLPAVGAAIPWHVPRGIPYQKAPGSRPVPDGPTETTAPVTDPAIGRIRRRYIRDILDMQERLSFRGLSGELEQSGKHLYRADRGQGVTVTAALTEHIPRRYLMGLGVFRLSQYLQAGFASPDIVFNRSLFCEPIQGFGAADIHVIATDTETGRILGYVSLAHSGDPEPQPASAPERVLFPCEQAHGMRLISLLPGSAGLSTHAIREVKRFVHDHAMTDRTQRLRVTLELLSGITGALCHPDSRTRMLVGDVERHVALRHLMLLGLEVHLVEGTTPDLGPTDLMHPMYVTREKVLPFIAVLPPREEAVRRAALVERAATAPAPFRAVRDLMGSLAGTVHSIEVAA
ncbi:hypothetical protein G3I19_20875 [Streptomyces sp. SID10853]|uniref:hypothetical protein n=1 Tax=Streptomyces sp. SID10853 TaxID=2706028 RepID=UPI0013C03463|nr:hypothetical protein [Streptomyces sp. SID10853]NDZ80942.1 hypothetical protein [Streptomyces sp. SID10853]